MYIKRFIELKFDENNPDENNKWMKIAKLNLSVNLNIKIRQIIFQK